MRIVAGAAKGRRLAAPKGVAVRPTSDRVKEALFSSLAPRLAGASVLDLYAGSGALGLEALSRGAASVTFVERSRQALAALHRNVEVVGLDGAHVVRGELPAALRGPLPGAPFDLVLADPPYELGDDLLREVLEALVVVVASGATVVVERATRRGPPPWPPALRPAASRRYGATTVHRAEHSPDAGGGTGPDREEPT